MAICKIFLIKINIIYNFKRSDIWLNNPFSQLDEREMITMIKDGSTLMSNLEEQFSSNHEISVFFYIFHIFI